MSYIEAADLIEPTAAPFSQGVRLTERDGTETYIQEVIDEIIRGRVDALLGDTFEPALGDPDETLELAGAGGTRLFLPRSVRSITTVKTRNSSGALTLESATTYRLTSSVSGGTAKVGVIDALDAVQYLSTGGWPIGPQTVQVVGKFGFTTPPHDVKRLTAKLTYQYFRPASMSGTSIQTRQTADGTITFGTDAETEAILRVYDRFEVMAR